MASFKLALPPVMGVESGHTTMLLLDVINPVVNLGICVGFKIESQVGFGKRILIALVRGVPTVGKPSSST